MPLSHEQALFAAAGQPKEMWIVPAGRHIEVLRRKEHQTRLLEYIEQLLARQ